MQCLSETACEPSRKTCRCVTCGQALLRVKAALAEMKLRWSDYLKWHQIDGEEAALQYVHLSCSEKRGMARGHSFSPYGDHGFIKKWIWNEVGWGGKVKEFSMFEPKCFFSPSLAYLRPQTWNSPLTALGSIKGLTFFKYGQKPLKPTQ